MNDQIVWENPQQKILWDKELSGQVSDGNWENAYPFDHWERPCKAESLVAKEGQRAGLNWMPRKTYGFNNTELLSIVGDRMLAEVTFHYPEYTWQQMRLDLRGMSRLFRNARAGRFSS